MSITHQGIGPQFTRQGLKMPKETSAATAVVTGYLQDADIGNPQAVIRYLSHDGVVGTLTVPRALLRSRAKLRDELDQRGVDYGEADLEGLMAAHKMSGSEVTYVVSRTGWRAGGFAWPGLVLTENGRELQFRAMDDLLLTFAARNGTMDGWRTEVCPALAQSSYAVFGQGWIFAGPLLSLSMAPEGGIAAIFGESGTGKTLVCMAAQAVLGSPERSLGPSWNATRAGVEDLLSSVRDFTLPLDDTSRDQQAERGRLSFLGDIAHTLAGGGKRQRSRSYEAQHGELERRQPALCLTSGESSLADIAKAVGRGVQGGVGVRFIDIKVSNGTQSGPPIGAQQGPLFFMHGSAARRVAINTRRASPLGEPRPVQLRPEGGVGGVWVCG